MVNNYEWKFKIGEKVWLNFQGELIETLVINHRSKYDIELKLVYDKEYLLKSLENNKCIWWKEKDINKIIKDGGNY